MFGKYVRNYLLIFIFRFLKNQSHVSSLPTIGFDYITKTIRLSDGSIINCHIYDTAGQERFKSLSVSYYKKADAVLLVYDISVRESFENVKNFYSKEKKNKSKNSSIIILLVGNKIDLESQRTVTYEEGAELASQKNYEFKETSCRLNKNVVESFVYILETWSKNNKNKKEASNESIDLTQKNKKVNPKKDCC